MYDWHFWARENQLPPLVFPGEKLWTHWLILAGRGFGKTRTGAEWVRGRAEAGLSKRIALIAPTAADVRDVMIEGESGILAISPPWFRPTYEPSKRRLTWPNGAVAITYSADEPERLRGPQHDAAWCDELCAWRYADAAWDMLMFGLRLGKHPQTCITTTPKPTKMLKAMMASKSTEITRGTTFDNMDNLAPTFREEIIAKYEGTRLGRQELNAEVLEDVAGALWSRCRLDSGRMADDTGQRYDRIVVAIDPPITSHGDECGIVAAGIIGDHGYVLADVSEGGLSPLMWARRAVELYHSLQADRIVVEVNQGGEMVTTLIAQVDVGVPVRAVHASRGKVLRAEPVAMKYEQGRVHHVGVFPKLEDQMCAFTSTYNRAEMGESPDRVDALVWALTDLMIGHKAPAKVRKV